MTRSHAREIALGCIFECFSRREAPEEILDERINAEGIADLASESWNSARIARMTRAILCLAMAEMEYGQDVPPSVAVNEAVELAKRYDQEKAPAYINGILGQYLRRGTEQAK